MVSSTTLAPAPCFPLQPTSQSLEYLSPQLPALNTCHWDKDHPPPQVIRNKSAEGKDGHEPGRVDWGRGALGGGVPDWGCRGVVWVYGREAWRKEEPRGWPTRKRPEPGGGGVVGRGRARDPLEHRSRIPGPLGWESLLEPGPSRPLGARPHRRQQALPLGRRSRGGSLSLSALGPRLGSRRHLKLGSRGEHAQYGHEGAPIPLSNSAYPDITFAATS